MTEQWTGDWMRDAETGQLIDGPAMNRYQMFMLIRELRAVIHAHAQTIRDKQAVIDAAEGRAGPITQDDPLWPTLLILDSVARHEVAPSNAVREIARAVTAALKQGQQ